MHYQEAIFLLQDLVRHEIAAPLLPACGDSHPTHTTRKVVFTL